MYNDTENEKALLRDHVKDRDSLGAWRASHPRHANYSFTAECCGQHTLRALRPDWPIKPATRRRIPFF